MISVTYLNLVTHLTDDQMSDHSCKYCNWIALLAMYDVLCFIFQHRHVTCTWMLFSIVSGTTMWGKKTHCFIFAISLSNLSLFQWVLAHIYFNKFASHVYFTFFIKSKSGNQLKLQHCSSLVHCSHTVFKLLCREMTDVFVVRKLWLANIQTLTV